MAVNDNALISCIDDKYLYDRKAHYDPSNVGPNDVVVKIVMIKTTTNNQECQSIHRIFYGAQHNIQTVGYAPLTHDAISRMDIH